MSRGDQDRQAGVFALIETEKEVVVYRGGWGFSLPYQHKVKVNESDRLVRLEMPQACGTYPLDRIEETGGELRLYLGDGGPLHASETERIGSGYGFPTIDDELVRLRVGCVNSVWPANSPVRRPEPSLCTPHVVGVLREAERPMRAREILALVEQIKGESVSWSWVKGCLSLNCSGPSARFQRVERGLYRLSRGGWLRWRPGGRLLNGL